MKKLMIIIGGLFDVCVAVILLLVALGILVGPPASGVKDGRYVYVPEETEEDVTLTFEFNKDTAAEQANALVYKETLAEAMIDSPLKKASEDNDIPADLLNHVDEVLHVWEGPAADTVFYRAGSDADPVQGFVIAKCQKEVSPAGNRYAYLAGTGVTTRPDDRVSDGYEKFIHLLLMASDMQQDLNPYEAGTRFVFGFAPKKEVETLEVEGQPVDGVVAYSCYGKMEYLWYFENLESRKRGDQLAYSVDVAKE